MIRKLRSGVLAAAMVAAFGSIAGAQSMAVMTRHVRDVTANGQARLIGPLAASDTMRLVLVLPLR